MKVFRIWSNYWKKYATEAELHMDGSVDAIFEDDDGVPHHENADLVVEFPTGLKDKNDKEIYEGDIVKARWYRAKNARLDTKGEIKFNDGWFYIKDDPDGQDRLGVPIHNCYDIEIVGNIHENPDLLEEEE